jgi:GTPase
MLDNELLAEIKNDLPNIPAIFISSVTGLGIDPLKDILWKELNS